MSSKQQVERHQSIRIQPAAYNALRDFAGELGIPYSMFFQTLLENWQTSPEKQRAAAFKAARRNHVDYRRRPRDGA